MSNPERAHTTRQAELDRIIASAGDPHRVGASKLVSAVNRSTEEDKPWIAEKLANTLDSHEDPKVRAACAVALASVGDAAVPPLIRALHFDTSDDVRAWAACALGVVGREGELDDLYRAVGESKDAFGHASDVACRAISAIGKIGGARATELLIEVWREAQGSQILRETTLGSIGRSGHAKGLDLIEEVLRAEDESMRAAAAYALAAIGSCNRDHPHIALRVRKLLRIHLADSNPRVRERAADGLAWVGEAEDIPVLKAIVGASAENGSGPGEGKQGE